MNERIKVLASDVVTMVGSVDVQSPLFQQAVYLVMLQIEEAQQGIVPPYNIPASRRDPVVGDGLRLKWEIVDGTVETHSQ